MDIFCGRANKHQARVTLVESRRPGKTSRLSVVLWADSDAISDGEWRAELTGKSLGLIGSRLFRGHGAEVEFGSLPKGDYKLQIRGEISGQLLVDIDVLI